jgi:hypothetical protein
MARSISGLICIFNQSLDIFEQIAQVVFDDSPHDLVINAVVAMGKNIPE